MENPLSRESETRERRSLRKSSPNEPKVFWFTLSFNEFKATKSEMKRWDTHRKGYLLRPGRIYAEIALVRLLKDADWDAVWIDRYRNKIWDDMPHRGRQVGLPKRQLDLFYRIREANDGEDAGCWDIWAWNGSRRHLFIEAKRANQDNVTEKQVQWFKAAKSVDVSPRAFCVAEWYLADAADCKSSPGADD